MAFSCTAVYIANERVALTEEQRLLGVTWPSGRGGQTPVGQTAAPDSSPRPSFAQAEAGSPCHPTLPPRGTGKNYRTSFVWQSI